MQIAFHIGANCTESDRLLKSILKNVDSLLAEGIAVPGPGRYRSLIRETIGALDGASPAQDARDVLLDTIVENDDIDRVVLSNDNFICVPNRIFDHGLLYSQIDTKTRALSKLFTGDDISLFLAIRNPTTFLQETFERSNASSIGEYMGMMQPQEIKWSDMMRRMKMAVPDIPLTVWCHEDSPLLWEQLIREITGVDPFTGIAGGLDMLSSIISKDGMALLGKRLKADPPRSNTQRHEIIAEIWETYALEDEIEDEIDLPELDPDVIAQMTEMYDDDVEYIGQMEGVRLLLPFT
jgi:hypothetical protein